MISTKAIGYTKDKIKYRITCTSLKQELQASHEFEARRSHHYDDMLKESQKFVRMCHQQGYVDEIRN